MPSYLAIQQLLDSAGINYRAACALLHLKEKGSDSMSAIASKINITAAGMTGVADKLHHGNTSTAPTAATETPAAKP